MLRSRRMRLMHDRSGSFDCVLAETRQDSAQDAYAQGECNC